MKICGAAQYQQAAITQQLTIDCTRQKREAKIMNTTYATYSTDAESALGESFVDAASADQLEAVAAILAHPTAAASLTDDDYAEALTQAASQGFAEVLATILENAAEQLPNWAYVSALKTSAHNGHATVVRMLLANENAVGRLPSWSYGSALRRACAQNKEGTVACLLGNALVSEKITQDAYEDAILASEPQSSVANMLKTAMDKKTGSNAHAKR